MGPIFLLNTHITSTSIITVSKTLQQSEYLRDNTMKKTKTNEVRKPAYWSHNRRALFKMDSPTRRQLVVGFLEPAEKNDISTNQPSDWTNAAVIHGTDQSHACRFLFTEDVHAHQLTGRNSVSFLFLINEEDLLAARLN